MRLLIVARESICMFNDGILRKSEKVISFRRCHILGPNTCSRAGVYHVTPTVEPRMMCRSRMKRVPLMEIKLSSVLFVLVCSQVRKVPRMDDGQVDNVVASHRPDSW
jgi:hypothetical protein